MTRRFIRDRLRGGETLLGCFVQTPRTATCEVVAASGFDVLVADAEHAALGPAEVEAILIGADVAGAPSLVRVAQNDTPYIQHALDGGAAGVIVPRVDDAASASRAVYSSRYPPQGGRGAGPGRASLYGLDREAAASEALAATLVAVQIESAAAVANLDAILAVEGVDMAFIGPNDLSWSLGRPPDEQLRATIDDVIARTHAAGLLTGILAPTPELVARYRTAGVKLILTGSDLAMLAAGARGVIAAAR